MIIIPFGHDDLIVKRLPFVTIGLIVICVIAFFPTSIKMDKDQENQLNALEAFQSFRTGKEHIKLPEEMLARMSKSGVERHNKHQEWVEWFLKSPNEVDAYLEARLEERGGTELKPLSPEIEGLLPMLNKVPGGSLQSNKLREIADGLEEGIDSEEKKERALTKFQGMGYLGIEEDQAEFARLYKNYKNIKENSVLGKAAYVPAKPSIIGLITHQFLHADIFHLLFNMLFLWVAACKLEDIWTRGVFLGVYLVCGMAGGIMHGVTHPDSTIPLIGASGAVAGLMGAFLIRLTKTQISFFYFYFFLRLTPKMGTFKAPAYLMLPLWFLGELFSGIFFDMFGVAYWAHVGGFLMGAAIALVFKLTDFEKRVLGKEPEVRVDPDEMPLVAFQAPPERKLEPLPSEPPPVAPLEVEKELEELEEIIPVPAPLPVVATSVRVNIRDIIGVDVSPDGLQGRSMGGMPVTISREKVSLIVPGRVDKIDPVLAREIFSAGSVPDEPAFLLALISPVDPGEGQDTLSGYIINASALNYEKVMRITYSAKHKNFAAFTKFLIDFYPQAGYVSGPGPMAKHNVPIYRDLEGLMSHIRDFSS